MDGGWLLRPDECLKSFFWGRTYAAPVVGLVSKGLGHFSILFFLPKAAPAQFHGAGPLVPKRLGSIEPMFLADTC